MSREELRMTSAEPQRGVEEFTEDSVLTTYTLEVLGPPMFSFRVAPALRMRLDEIMLEAQENMTDLLPAGFHVWIRKP
jgi:hypothetical protein